MNIYKDELATYIPYEHLVVKESEYKKIIDYNLTFICCKYMDQISYYFESNETKITNELLDKIISFLS